MLRGGEIPSFESLPELQRLGWKAVEDHLYEGLIEKQSKENSALREHLVSEAGSVREQEAMAVAGINDVKMETATLVGFFDRPAVASPLSPGNVSCEQETPELTGRFGW